MGETAIQKILSAHAGGRPLQPGELLWARIDWACIDDVQWPIFRDVFADLGGKVFDRERVIVIADHYLPPSDIGQAETLAELRAFAESHDIPHAFFEDGIKHQVLIEKGLVKPGDLLLATDSHTPTAGAAGAIGVGVGPTEVAVVFAYGEAWLRVPQTVRIVLDGALSAMVFAKDIALHILGREGTRFGNYRVLEYAGASGMRLSERLTLCNMATEMGTKAAFFELSEAEAALLGRRPVTSDPDAPFEREIRVDLDRLEPLVAFPHLPSNVDSVSRFRDVKVHQAFIGSCANATFDDLAIAAGILRGKRVKGGVQMIVSPSSRAAYQRAVREGIVEILIDAGAVVTNTGCGACAGGHIGVLGPGQVRISSQNRNFIGRAGHRDSRIYLASPAVVAASAITGYISDPREVTGA